MKFGEYLKNRDPQFAEGLNEGLFGPALTPEQKQMYGQYRNEIDELVGRYRKANMRIALPQAIDEFMKTNGAQLANMKRAMPPERDPGKVTPQSLDYGSASNSKLIDQAGRRYY